MRKQKEKPITVTYSETLCWAINWMMERWNNERERIQAVADIDPDAAKEYVQQSFYRQKLIVLLQMYKIETGEDFGTEIDLDI